MSSEQTPSSPPSGSPAEAAPLVDGETLPVLAPEAAFGRHGGGPKKRKKRKIHIPGQDVTELNLTAMMDMMTILLVFLLKSYASEPDKFQVNEKMRPPQSTIEHRMAPAVTMIITADEIVVDDERVVKISDLATVKTATDASIPPLVEALSQRAEHLKKLEGLGGQPFDGKLLVVAHQTTSYELLTTVLYSAGQAHFSKYSLVVMDDGKAK